MDTDATNVARSPETTMPDEQVWREVMAQLRTFVGRRIADPHRADDLVAEVLLRIHKNLHTVDDRERLTHWVSRVAHNAVIDEYRRAAREREHRAPTLVEAVPDEQPPSSDASDAPPEVQRELAACLRPLLGGLPPEQRRAVEMIDLDGWAQARAARTEGVSVSGMKSRVQRGRRGLATLLDKCCTVDIDARGLPMDYTPRSSCGCGDPGQ